MHTLHSSRRTFGQRPIRTVKLLAEWTAVAVVGSLYAAAYMAIGWIAAGLTGFVLWLGWYTGAITFRSRRTTRPAVVDAPTVEWGVGR